MSRSRAINAYLEPNSDGSFFRVRRSPGLRSRVTVGEGPIRGMFEIQDELFVASRNRFYKVDTDYNVTDLGEIAGATSRVYIDANGADDNQIIVKADNKGYIYDPTIAATVQEITDGDFEAGGPPASLNQIFWVPRINSNTLQGSGTADGNTWTTGRRVSAEQNPDLLRVPVTIKSALWLLGDKTTEYWQTDPTDTTNPIRPVAGATIQRGILAPDSFAKYEDSVFWLADDGTVWQTKGSSAAKISDLNIEYAIRGDGKLPGYTNPQAAEGFFIDHPVHKLYVLTFPSDDATWIYDVATQLWHERQSEGIGRWRGRESQIFNDEILVGDYREGTLWLFTEEEFTEGGDSLPYQIWTPVVRDIEKDIYISHMELHMEVGVGSSSRVNNIGVPKKAPIPPKMRVEYSKDGGITWHAKPDLSFGSVGDREIRVISRLFGRVKRDFGFMLRFTVTDDAPVEMYELYLDIEKGI
jgi:hypothetical protein